MLFINISATSYNAWIPIRDDPMPSEGPTPEDDVSHEVKFEFMESFIQLLC